MGAKPRIIKDKLKSLFDDFPAVAVLGARQVGKTTLLHDLFLPQAGFVTFDPVMDVGNARKDPDLFLKSRSTPLILDEIQYVPELVPALKRQIDSNRSKSRYLITGSQQWEVMKGLSESLAGRVAFLELEGFSICEISEKKSWLGNWLGDPQDFLASMMQKKWIRAEISPFDQLWRGWFPEAQTISLSSVPTFYQSYQRTYLDRDVRLIQEISDVSLFGRFLSYCAALSAQEVNYAHFGRELGIHAQTAKQWLSLLRQTFQWFEIPAYSNNALKKISEKPKGYLCDSGLMCVLQFLSSPQALAGHPLFGAAFETAVVQEIRKQNHSLMSPAGIFHWRSHGGAEVDLVLERDGILFPIEIKGKSHPDRRDASGIEAFRRAYPRLRIAGGLIISLCEAPYAVTEKDWAMPWDLCF